METLERLLAIIHLGPPFPDEVGVEKTWKEVPDPQEVIAALIEAYEEGLCDAWEEINKKKEE